jgi:hypothetical protein
MARYQCYEGFSFASGKQHEEIFCTDEGRWTQMPKCKSTVFNFLKLNFYESEFI